LDIESPYGGGLTAALPDSTDMLDEMAMGLPYPLEEDPEMVAYFLKSFGDGFPDLDHDELLNEDTRPVNDDKSAFGAIQQPPQPERQLSSDLPRSSASMISPTRGPKITRPASTPTTRDVIQVLDHVEVRLVDRD